MRELTRTEKRQHHNLDLTRGDASSPPPTVEIDVDVAAVGDDCVAEAGPLLSGASAWADVGEGASRSLRRGDQNEDDVDLVAEAVEGGGEVGGREIAAAGGAAGHRSVQAGLVGNGNDAGEGEFMPWFVDVEGARFGLEEPVEAWAVLAQGGAPPLRGDDGGLAAGAGADGSVRSALERVVAYGGEEAKWKEAVGSLTDDQVGQWLSSVGVDKQHVQRVKKAGEIYNQTKRKKRCRILEDSDHSL